MKEVKHITKFKHISFSGGGSMIPALIAAHENFKKNHNYLHSTGGTSAGSLIAFNIALGVPSSFIKHHLGIAVDTKKLEIEGLEPTSLSGIVLSLIHISEPTRQAEISYAVFCLKKKT